MRIFVYEAVCAGALGWKVTASLQREGWAMLSTVVTDFQRLADIEVVTLLSDGMPGTLGHVCTRVPWTWEGDSFREIAATCTWTLVIAPEFDGILEDRSQIVLAVGSQLIGSLPSAIRLTADKLALASHWRSMGVPHPSTDLIDPVEFARFAPPWVVKPRYGAGSQATILIPDHALRAELHQAARRECPAGGLLVQRHVPGEPASVALLIGTHRTLPLLPGRQHISSDGRFRYQGGSLPLPAPFAERAIRLAQQAVAGIPGLRGYVGIDLVLGEREDHVIEINPRLTTSYIGLRRLCRANLAELMLHCAQDEPIAAPTWLDGEARFAADGFVDAG